MRARARRLVPVDLAEARQTWTTFRPVLRGLRGPMIGAVLLSIGVTVTELLRPWPVTWVVDHLVAADDPSTAPLAPLVVFGIVALLVPVVGGVLDERLQLTVARISRRATVRLRSDLFEHLHRIDLAEHQRRFSGDLLVRLMGDVNMVRDLLFASWLTLLSRTSLLVGSAVVFAVVDWRLLAVAVLPMPLLAVDMRRTSSKVRSASSRSRRKEGAIAAEAAESLRNIGLVKAFAAEERATDRFRDTARRAEKATMAAARHTAGMSRRTESLTGAGVALVLLVGALRVRSGLLTPGELVLAVSYTRSLYKPLRKITGEGARLGRAMACAGRVQDILGLPAESDGGNPAPRLDGEIELRGVHHRYPDGRASLNGIDLRIPGGGLVAITGENGTGKSTLLSLLTRLHRPAAGSISIGGAPIEEMSLASYRKRIAVVPQQLALFSGTIRENIAFGDPDASGAEVLAAAEAALLLPVLARLPDGLDTPLTESGGSLSGGEARRVMLARAAVRDADLILLDEPLVGLDPDARTSVIAAIRNISRDRTALVVHHGDLDELAPDVHVDLSRIDGLGAAVGGRTCVRVTGR